MTADLPDQALELRSLVTSQGTLELSLHDVPVPKPAANEVLVRVEASPINPSDLGLLFGAEILVLFEVLVFEGHPHVLPKIAPALRELVKMIGPGGIRQPITATYPIDRVKEAVAHAVKGGRILLNLSEG